MSTETENAGIDAAAAVPAEETKAAKKEKQVNNVTMENGTVIDFGRGNLKMEQVDNTLIINVVTGKTFTFDANKWIAKAADFVKKIFFIGAMQKLRIATLNIKERAELDSVVAETIKQFDAGIIAVRAAGVKLSILQEAWAFTMANMEKYAKAYSHWKNPSTDEIKNEILKVWEGFSKEQIAVIKASRQVRMQIAQIEAQRAASLQEVELPEL